VGGRAAYRGLPLNELWCADVMRMQADAPQNVFEAHGRGTGTGKLMTSGVELMSGEYVATVAAAFPQSARADFN
jgi:hypothetical protein